jgi:heat shock protein HtpX
MYEQISRNKRRTAAILAAFFLLIIALGISLDFWFQGGGLFILIAVVIASVSAIVSYYKSDTIALAATHARPADPNQYRQYHNLVEGLCIASGLPKPRLYIVDDPAPNAFATGRNPEHAALAVTTGLLALMNRAELEGVIGHELSHIKNYDILVTTIAVVAVGVIVLISDFGLRFFAFGGGRRQNNDNNGGGLGGLIAIVSILLLILAPLAGYLMQFAMSRNREYLADASSVELTRNPAGLTSALEKLRENQSVVRHTNRATAQMWIESPLDREEGHKGSRLNRLFDTHPPLADRITRLGQM